jgi:hypothetical protein
LFDEDLGLGGALAEAGQRTSGAGHGPEHRRVREALMQPLAPEVSSASSGHLGHQVTDVGGLARVVDQNTRHTKQGMYG